MSIGEEVLKISSRVGIVEANYRHLSSQINVLENLTKENVLELKKSHEELQKQLHQLLDSLNQIKGAYKMGAFLLGIIGIQGIVIVLKMLERI